MFTAKSTKYEAGEVDADNKMDIKKSIFEGCEWSEWYAGAAAVGVGKAPFRLANGEISSAEPAYKSGVSPHSKN